MSDASYERGLEIRREMFGREATDAQIAGADEFNTLIQDVVTRYCFGETWSREGLDLKVRSMLTIAMLAVLGREPETRNHIRGALANGVSREEVAEIFLHAAVYGGVPAGVGGFRAASEVFAELDASSA